MSIERLSIALTNRCKKACWFCYAESNPDGGDAWSLEDVVALVHDCIPHGLRAVSFGGGEPLEVPWLFELFGALRGRLFRSMTTNGSLLEDPAVFAKLVAATPDKVHVSVHFPSDAERVIQQVQRLNDAGIRSGINLLVRRSQLEVAADTARTIRASGIDNSRIVYLPMRIQDTPDPREVARVAGGPFQSMSCLRACAASPRFVSLGWDRTVAKCSYTSSKRPLEAPTHAALMRASGGLDLVPCDAAGVSTRKRSLPIAS